MSSHFEPENIQGIKCFCPHMARDGNDYPLEAFKRLVELEDKNFWFRSRNRILLRVFRKYIPSPANPRVLEIGCGTGYVLSGLKSEDRYVLVGADLHIDGLLLAKQRLPDVEFVQLNARDLPYVSEFDAVGVFDVLEHIEEDNEVMRSAYQALVPGGVFIVTVPQHQWLWSAADIQARHKRRYSRIELISKLEQQGFAVEYCSSFVSFLLPLMFLSRMVNHKNSPYIGLALPRPINALMGAIMAIDELFISAGISLPAGGSLLAIAKRSG